MRPDRGLTALVSGFVHPLRVVLLSSIFCMSRLTCPEWIKGLLAVPFVLYSQPAGVFAEQEVDGNRMVDEAHRRYAEIMRDVELMIDDHSKSVNLISCRWDS